MNKLAIVTFILGFGISYILIAMSQEEIYFVPEGPSRQKETTLTYQKKIDTLKKEKRQINQQLIQAKAALVKLESKNALTVSRLKELANDTSTEKPPEFTDEEIENRLLAIKGEFALMKENGDGKGLVNLVKELRKYGPAAYKQIIEIATLLDADRWKGRKFSRTFNKHEFDKAFPPEIYAWALKSENFEEVGATFRMRAYHALPYTDAKNIDELLVNAFALEDSRWGSRTLSRTLRERPSEETTNALISTLRTNEELNQEARRRMEDVIYDMPGDAVDDYIQEQIDNTDNEDKLSELKYTQLYRDPPATGYLIQEIYENTQAASWGLKMGDTIVKYGNVDLKEMDLERAKRETGEVETVTITILRNGQEMSFEAKPGQIGIDGDRVRKK